MLPVICITISGVRVFLTRIHTSLRDSMRFQNNVLFCSRPDSTPLTCVSFHTNLLDSMQLVREQHFLCSLLDPTRPMVYPKDPNRLATLTAPTRPRPRLRSFLFPDMFPTCRLTDSKEHGISTLLFRCCSCRLCSTSVKPFSSDFSGTVFSSNLA